MLFVGCRGPVADPEIPTKTVILKGIDLIGQIVVPLAGYALALLLRGLIELRVNCSELRAPATDGFSTAVLRRLANRLLGASRHLHKTGPPTSSKTFLLVERLIHHAALHRKRLADKGYSRRNGRFLPFPAAILGR